MEAVACQRIPTLQDLDPTRFCHDDNGASHSVLVTATRGTFAFIAGQMAKTGSLRIDTPVGMIRGRAHAGGFGMLTLTALAFAILPEAHAADSNVTLLDDDSITYKDLPHGMPTTHAEIINADLLTFFKA